MRVLLVDNHQNHYESIQTLLANIKDLTLDWIPSQEEGHPLVLRHEHEVCLVGNDLAFIRQAVSNGCTMPLILLADQPDPNFDALKAGAADFLVYAGLDTPKLEHSLRYAIEHAKTTARLQIIERQLKALLENSPINIFAVNKEGIYIQAAGLYNTAKDILIGKSIYDIFSDNPDFIEKFESALKGHPSGVTTEFRGRIYDNWYAPIYDGAGEVMGVIGFSQDITERRWFEETFQHYTSELEARTRELHAYNYTIAHDLKSPLSMMIGYAGLAEEAIGDNTLTDAVKFIQEIVKAGQNMRNMIDQLLHLASETQATENRQRLDIQFIVDTALFRFKYQIETHHITINIDPDLPPAIGHAPWVEQIFANLIGNAVKYRQTDHPVIHIRGKQEASVSRYEIEDNGIGISLENQKGIFELFGRVQNLNVEGSGIGLAIVQRMVKKLDGEIGVISTLGKGSTFWFTLPAPST